jgi:hypothetical protein
MYAKIENNAVVQYPYSVAQLKQEHPTLTFPETKEALEALGCFHVVVTGQPPYDYTQNCIELTPEYNAAEQQWEQRWSVIAASQQEIDERTAAQSTVVRQERTKLLFQSDWTQLADAPTNALQWANYRQALRDVPTQTGFPWSVVWPTPPQ